MKDKLIIATRGSKLAMTQSGMIAQLLRDTHSGLEVDLRVISTRGDRTVDRPLPQIGGKGLFTEELEADLRSGDSDLAVHSLKDLPVESPPEFEVAAIPKRAPANDVLIARAPLAGGLPSAGMVVGTGSPRRASQIVRMIAGVKTVGVRGNVDTRLKKLADGEFDVLMLAAAGLKRMNINPEHAYHLDPFEFLPAPGQGALGIQIRSDRDDVRKLLKPIDDADTRAAATAERAVLLGLGGGCSVPVGSYAECCGGKLKLRGGVFSPDGGQGIVEQLEVDCTDAAAAGARLARQLIERGASAILEEYR